MKARIRGNTERASLEEQRASLRAARAPRSCRLVHAGALEASGNDRHIRQSRPFSAAPPPFACHRRRDGQVQEPHVAQPVEQGAQERCGLTNCRGLDKLCRPAPPRRCAASVCPLTLPCPAVLLRHQEAEDVQVLFDQGGASGPPNGRPAAPLPLPPRQPTTRCSNAFHAGWAARMRRQRWRLAPACPDPSSCLMP